VLFQVLFKSWDVAHLQYRWDGSNLLEAAALNGQTSLVID
jgi:hypothetical protein